MLPFCRCCSKDTTELAKEIGIGSTLFLMTLKSFAWLFFFLTLVNIPLLYFYSKGPGLEHDASDYWSMFTLGHIGDQEVWQGKFTGDSASITCEAGTIGKLRYVGVLDETESDPFTIFSESNDGKCE